MIWIRAAQRQSVLISITVRPRSQVCSALVAELQRQGADLSMEDGSEMSFSLNNTDLPNTDLSTLVADAMCLSCLHRLKHFLKASTSTSIVWIRKFCFLLLILWSLIGFGQQLSYKLSADKCIAFNPYAKCNDRPVAAANIVFNPLPIDASVIELCGVDVEADVMDKLEGLLQQLVADALETADDVGVLGGNVEHMIETEIRRLDSQLDSAYCCRQTQNTAGCKSTGEDSTRSPPTSQEASQGSEGH